ncbi:MAG: hypothetical protein NTU69_03390 [Proteobacteria bacterium]|nr:hypothetical protein [Pseudomonadota bacterium]
MEEIIQAISDAADLKNKAKEFSRLSREKKIELLQKIKDIKSGPAGTFLNMVYPDEKDKDIQKLIKKLLFRLKTVGLKVDEPKITGEPALRRIEEKREHRGFISNYDTEGTRLVCAAFGIKKNYFIFINAITHFSDGVLELTSTPVDRRDLETILNEYRQRTNSSIVFVEISPKYASYIINETSAYSGKFTQEVKQLKQFTSNIKSKIQKPEDIYGLEIPDKTNPLPMEKILSNDIVEPFKLSWNTLENDKKEFANIGSSTIVLPPYMVEEKKQAFIKILLERDNLKQKLPLIRRMMEDYAYIFYCLHEYGAYNGLIEMLQDKNAPHGILFLFTRKSLEEAGQQKQPGLIVNPYEQIRS